MNNKIKDFLDSYGVCCDKRAKTRVNCYEHIIDNIIFLKDSRIAIYHISLVNDNSILLDIREDNLDFIKEFINDHRIVNPIISSEMGSFIEKNDDIGNNKMKDSKMHNKWYGDCGSCGKSVEMSTLIKKDDKFECEECRYAEESFLKIRKDGWKEDAIGNIQNRGKFITFLNNLGFKPMTIQGVEGVSVYCYANIIAQVGSGGFNINHGLDHVIMGEISLCENMKDSITKFVKCHSMSDNILKDHLKTIEKAADIVKEHPSVLDNFFNPYKEPLPEFDNLNDEYKCEFTGRVNDSVIQKVKRRYDPKHHKAIDRVALFRRGYTADSKDAIGGKFDGMSKEEILEKMIKAKDAIETENIKKAAGYYDRANTNPEVDEYDRDLEIELLKLKVDSLESTISVYAKFMKRLRKRVELSSPFNDENGAK